MGAVKKQHKKNWPRIASIKTRQSARNREIYRQYVEDHKRQTVLADEHGLSREAISQIVRAVDREIREDLATDVGAIKRKHTQRLEKLYRESMAAWEHSKENFKKYTRVNKRAVGKEVTVTIERQCGDARFLETAMKALADIRKIWGADAPVKQEHSGAIDVHSVDVSVNIKAALMDPTYLEFLRQRRLAEPGDTGPVCIDVEQRPLETGPPPGIPGPLVDGHRGGEDSETDR